MRENRAGQTFLKWGTDLGIVNTERTVMRKVNDNTAMPDLMRLTYNEELLSITVPIT